MAAAWIVLREARRAAGLTQAVLADRAGVTQGAIAQMERPGSNPTVETLGAVVAATGHRLELVAARRSTNVDETLIARNLRMTPAQRIAAFEAAHSEVEALRGLVGTQR